MTDEEIEALRVALKYIENSHLTVIHATPGWSAIRKLIRRAVADYDARTNDEATELERFP